MLEAIVQDEDSFVSATVLGEIDVGRPLHCELDAVRRATWLTPVRLEGLAELTVFAEYVRILGSGPRNIGEAETLAWAETHEAVAVIDERAGARAGQQRGVAVHGTLWLIARAIRAAALERHEVVELIDALADAEAWFPSEARGEGFFRWAAEHGLIEE